MPVALAGHAPASFEIKSANLPLVALLLKSTDLTQLGVEWQQRFGDIPDFFDNDPLVIDLSPLGPDVVDLDFSALLTLLRNHRLTPIAFKGGSESLALSALAAGLVVAGDVKPVQAPAPRVETVVQQVVHEVVHEVVREVQVPSTLSPSAMVIDKPLRSGQQIYAKGRDLVVLAMVNPGAEVIADGHIHVYAPLRGKAIAGAKGNADARIFALCMEPQLISIAGVYRTTDTPLSADVWGKATQIRLEGGSTDGKLLLEPLKL